MPRRRNQKIELSPERQGRESIRFSLKGKLGHNKCDSVLSVSANVSKEDLAAVTDPFASVSAQTMTDILRDSGIAVTTMEQNITNLLLEDLVDHKPGLKEADFEITAEDIKDLAGDLKVGGTFLRRKAGVNLLSKSKSKSKVSSTEMALFTCNGVHIIMNLFARWSAANHALHLKEYYQDDDTKALDARGKEYLKQYDTIYNVFHSVKKSTIFDLKVVQVNDMTSSHQWERLKMFFDLYSLLWFHDESLSLRAHLDEIKMSNAKQTTRLQELQAQAGERSAFASKFAGCVDSILDVDRWNDFIELVARIQRAEFLKGPLSQKSEFAAGQAAFWLARKITLEQKAQSEAEEEEEETGCGLDLDTNVSEQEILRILESIESEQPRVLRLAVGINRNLPIADALENELGKAPSSSLVREKVIKKYWDLADDHVPFDSIDPEDALPEYLGAQMKKYFRELIAVQLPKGASASLLPTGLDFAERKEMGKAHEELAQVRKDNATLQQNDLDFALATENIRLIAARRAAFCFQGFPRVSIVEAKQLFDCVKNKDDRVIKLFFEYLEDILEDIVNKFKLDQGEEHSKDTVNKSSIYTGGIETDLMRGLLLTPVEQIARTRLKIEQRMRDLGVVIASSELSSAQKVAEMEKIASELSKEWFASNPVPKLLPKPNALSSQRYGTDMPYAWFQDARQALLKSDSKLDEEVFADAILQKFFEFTTVKHYYPEWLQTAFNQYRNLLKEGVTDVVKVFEPLAIAFYENRKWVPLLPKLFSESNITGFKTASEFALGAKELRALDGIISKLDLGEMKKLYPQQAARIAAENKVKMQLGMQKEDIKEINRQAIKVLNTAEAREQLGITETKKQMKREARAEEAKTEALKSKFADVSAKLSKGKIYKSVLEDEGRGRRSRNLERELELEEKQRSKRRSREKSIEKEAKRQVSEKGTKAIQTATDSVLANVKALALKKAQQAALERQKKAAKQATAKRGGLKQMPSSSSSSSSSSSFSSSSSSSSMTSSSKSAKPIPGRKQIRPKQGEGILKSH